MKKAKLMLGVTALSAALLGTGYAAMTDTVNIGGKVSTANFCVQFIEEPQLKVGDKFVEHGTTEGNSTIEQFKTDNEITYLNAELIEEGGAVHKINFGVTNLKADVPITYKTKIGNLSSIDAQLESVLVTPNNANYPAKSVNLTVVIGEGKDSIIYTGDLEKLVTTRDMKNLVLQEVNNSNTDEVPVTFTVEVEEDAVADHTEAEAKSVEFTLAFNWRQLNGAVQ